MGKGPTHLLLTACVAALLPSLRYRRGGAVIRQALGDFLDEEETPPTAQAISASRSHIQEKTDDGQE